MLDELFLVAHKVRGQSAFDVAIKMDCPLCEAQGCHECDDCGYFWIIPTSGHRAYPFYTVPLNQCVDMHYMDGDVNKPMIPPPNWPDHYLVSAAPRLDLAKALGITAKPQPPIQRRF